MADGFDAPTFVRTLTRAEAASAAEAWGDAAAYWAEVVAANPVEGRFWRCLADARYHARHTLEAIVAYERALDLRASFPAETAYRIAACHALLEQRDQALDWLERALDLGFRHLDHARTDEDLACLRDAQRFKDLVGLADSTRMTRDEGWRYDLQFLAREIKRRAYDPFRFISEERFDASVAQLNEAIPRLTDAQVIVEMKRLLPPLGDAHARLYPPPERADLQQAMPLQFFLFPEGLCVVAADPRFEELLGAQVLRFDNAPVADAIAAVAPLIPRDNDNAQWPQEVLPYRLRELWLLHALGLIPTPDRVTLTVRGRDGDIRSVVVVADPDQPASKLRKGDPLLPAWRQFAATLLAPLPFSLKNRLAAYWFEYLPDERVVYFQFNSVRDAPPEPFAAFCARMFDFIAEHAVDKLVVDLRWNGGGNTFLEMPFLHRIIASKVNRRGALFAIIGRATFSAAQNGASMLDRHTEAIFVGEPTGSSPTFVGETVEFALPYSEVRANVSDLLWQGTWPMDYRTWIAPTLYTPPTFAAYQANRDPALEAILACREHLPSW